jgi:hypothetical protein
VTTEDDLEEIEIHVGQPDGSRDPVVFLLGRDQAVAFDWWIAQHACDLPRA